MNKLKLDQKSVGTIAKETWNPYGLQPLTERRFLEVVSKILKGENSILTLRTQSDSQVSL